MKCNICFWKDSQLKSNGPIINALLENGILVNAYLNIQTLKDKNKGNHILLFKELFNDELLNVDFFSNSIELEQLFIKSKPDFLITYETDGLHYIKNFNNYDILFSPQGTKVFSLQWTFESTNTEQPFSHGNPKFLKDRTKYFCYGDYFKKYYKSLLQKRGQFNEQIDNIIENTFIPVNGSPILDSFYKTSDHVIKKKYNIPANKKIVLFMAPHIQGLKNTYKDPWYSYIFLENSKFLSVLKLIARMKFSLIKEAIYGYRYTDLLDSMKIFCNKNDALFIVKVRNKNSENMNIYLKNCDLLISEESMVPYTTIELLQVSNLVIQFVSSGIFEILISKVPSITIVFPFINKLMKYHNKHQFYSNRVTTLLDHNQFIEEIPHSSLEKYYLNKKDISKSIKKYFGEINYNSSDTIVKYIINYLSKNR